jgi:hypothetical protein
LSAAQRLKKRLKKQLRDSREREILDQEASAEETPRG